MNNSEHEGSGTASDTLRDRLSRFAGIRAGLALARGGAAAAVPTRFGRFGACGERASLCMERVFASVDQAGAAHASCRFPADSGFGSRAMDALADAMTAAACRPARLRSRPSRFAIAVAAVSGYWGGYAAVAQLVEHVIRNDGVGGSSPFCGTTPSSADARPDSARQLGILLCRSVIAVGRVHLAAEDPVGIARVA